MDEKKIILRYSLVGEIIERECKTLDEAMYAAYMHDEHLTGLPLEIIGSKRYTRVDMHNYWRQEGWNPHPQDDILERAIRRDYIVSDGVMKKRKDK